jgi:NAD(P)-dependent dehydrogenase (short-subunit alcohol dehydrogenase family)
MDLSRGKRAAADVTDTVALTEAVEQIAHVLGGLDLLVANAGHAAELIRVGLPHLRRSASGD